jgi:hypothetical protein
MFEPLGNTTILPPTQWHPEPKFRGTFSILSSCLITMVLCIWTSLHLNLPEHKKEYQQKYRKLGWMVLGLLAPELVVWNAWEQRKRAKQFSALMEEKGFMSREPSIWIRIREWLAKAWRDMQVFLLLKAEDWPDLADPTPSRGHNHRHNAWTDVHSWYVVMGGMSFQDALLQDEQLMPEDRPRQILSLNVFKLVVDHRPHLVPDISREYIEDKSKSDWLAKLLTCWQAGYFCIQCGFRLSQQLSITLLELNVFAHVICFLILLLVWWDKPQDIREPTFIVGEEALDIYACLCHLHGLSTRSGIYFDDVTANGSPPLNECFEVAFPKTFIARYRMDSRERVQTAVQAFIAAGPIRYKYLKVCDTYWRMRAINTEHRDTAVTTTGREIRWLKRLCSLMREAPALHFSVMSLGIYSELRITRSGTSDWALTEGHLGLLLGEESWSQLLHTQLVWPLAGVTFAAECYGGLHLTAWASTFPSPTEALLWRAASVTILVTGPSCAVYMVCCSNLAWLSDTCDYRHDTRVYFFSTSSWLVVICLLSLSTLWYIICRAFIVVESFIMLAHIPETALHVPTWASYIPSFN